VIVQYESVFRLNIHDLDKTILILDEAEFILTLMESLQVNNGDHPFSRWINFNDLVKNANKVIAMDAYTGFRTYEILASSLKHVQIINNLWQLSPEEAPIDMYYDKQEAFMAPIAATAINAKTAPFVVVSTLRTQAKIIHKHCKAACPNVVIKKYNSNSSAADCNFDDVNKVWANVDILIYTSTISASCSFECPHFTCVFGYFSLMSTDYKTAVQMLGRVRNISTQEYHIHINNRSHDLPIHYGIMKFHVWIQCFDRVIPNSPWFFPVKHLYKLGSDLSLVHSIV